MKKPQWKQLTSNQILEATWGRVSYNPQTGNGCGVFTDLGNILGANVSDGEETALYDNETWRVLTGDFRKEYEKAFPNWKKCLAVYNKHKEKSRNNWSTD